MKSLACSFAVLAFAGPAETPPAREPSGDEALPAVRRIYVDRLNGGETAAQIRDMIMSALQATRVFIITENLERADAVLRGSGEDLIFTDTYSSGESVSARASVGSSSRSSRGISAGIGESESSRVAERKHEAIASVRLVAKNGDVIWSTTQESTGGKFRGAAADVAEKVAKQLAQDYNTAVKSRSAPASTAMHAPG